MVTKLWDSDEVCLQLKDYLPDSMVVEDTTISYRNKKLAWLEPTASSTAFEGFPNTFTMCLKKGINDAEILDILKAMKKIESLFPEITLYFWLER